MGMSMELLSFPLHVERGSVGHRYLTPALPSTFPWLRFH